MSKTQVQVCLSPRAGSPSVSRRSRVKENIPPLFGHTPRLDRRRDAHQHCFGRTGWDMWVMKEKLLSEFRAWFINIGRVGWRTLSRGKIRFRRKGIDEQNLIAECTKSTGVSESRA